MKKNVLLVALALSAGSAFAQLSTRENDAVNVMLGARPGSGDLALTFAMDLNNDPDKKADLYSGNLLNAGDLLTVKYYLSDNIALRAGIRLTKLSEKAEGAFSDSSFYYDTFQATFERSTSEREYVFVPGIEYHFSNSNIFDVYAGGDLFVGLGSQRTVNDMEWDNGDFTKVATRKNTNVYGLGGVIGFNVFIAQLPISLGLEYGLNAKWTRGGQTRVNREDRITNVSNVQEDFDTEYYLDEDYDPANVDPVIGVPGSGQDQYSDLKMKQFGMDTNQNVRLTLNIYFGM